MANDRPPHQNYPVAWPQSSPAILPHLPARVAEYERVAHEQALRIAGPDPLASVRQRGNR
jgi:hypothetical protein